ncbi:MAG TPA: hypothetical protein PKE45_20685, partial [Caldilineaceae bacterium]|nr:hypothetical protein [Caldilineaceae bacterium]
TAATPTATEIPTETVTATPTDTATPTATATTEALLCNPSGGAGGLEPGTHDVMLAGHPATIIVGDAYTSTTPTFLAYYLHGDEGGYDIHANTENVVNQFIRTNGWVYVAPQAPALSAGYYPWTSNGIPSPGADANLQEIVDVLEDMFAHYNVCRNVLFGGSHSGGSWFYDAYVFPNKGGEYPSYFNLNCGAAGVTGDGFWTDTGLYQKLQALSADPDILARAEFKFSAGDADFLYPYAVTSSGTLTDLGFMVSTDFFPGVDHCGYDISTSVRDYWQQKSSSLTLPDKP